MQIIPRSAWGARYARGFRAAPLPAKEVWLHHSVTVAPNLTPPFTDDDAAVRTLENIGQQRFGGGISYTFAVTPVGRIYEGHGIDRQGAHTGGRNSIARAICLVGNYETSAPTEAQINAVAWLLQHGKQQGWWNAARLTGGHRDAPGASTACPGRRAYAMIGEINRRAAAGVQPGPPADTNGDDEMGLQQFVVGPTNGVAGMRLIVPTGKASTITARSWISMVVNGPEKGSGRVWAQNDASGIDDRWFNMGFADGRSGRDWWELPDGTTQLSIHYNMPQGGTILLEWLGK